MTEIKEYQVPRIEILEVEIERGFSQSQVFEGEDVI